MLELERLLIPNCFDVTKTLKQLDDLNLTRLLEEKLQELKKLKNDNIIWKEKEGIQK